MIKKVASLWFNLQKKKTLSDLINVISSRTTYLLNNTISNSIVFYISSFSGLLSKKINIFNINKIYINFYTIFYFIFTMFILSLLLFLISKWYDFWK